MSSKSKARRPVETESSDSDSGSDDVEQTKPPPSKKSKAESSDSDSGPDDVEQTKPPPSKKNKAEGAPANKGASKSGAKNSDGSIQFEFGKNRFVSVREFKGKTFVDLREFYMDNSGELKPGKKGIALFGDQWKTFKGLIPDIDKALKSFN